VGEYVVAFLLKTPFLTKRGFLFYKMASPEMQINSKSKGLCEIIG
jgi:hypothetical protein